MHLACQAEQTLHLGAYSTGLFIALNDHHCPDSNTNVGILINEIFARFIAGRIHAEDAQKRPTGHMIHAVLKRRTSIMMLELRKEPNTQLLFSLLSLTPTSNYPSEAKFVVFFSFCFLVFFFCKSRRTFPHRSNSSISSERPNQRNT